MVRVLVVCILGMWLTAVHAQELVFTTPVPFNNAINTEDEELAPVLAPDGKTMYFIRAFHSGNTGGKLAGSDVWVSRKDAMGFWMPATRMDAAWNNKRSNAVIGVNADNTVVYLLNAYNNKSGISFSKLYGGQWSTPEFIAIPGISKDDFVGFYVSPAFDVIFISMKGKDSYGEEDLYISLKDAAGHWTEPRNLGPTINTSGFEISPFLSADKKRLYFSSNGHGGFGDADIFYCDRLFDSWETWGVPKNLGSEINTKAFDGYFSICDSAAFLISNRSGGNSNIFRAQVVQKQAVPRIQQVDQYLSSEQVSALIGVTPILSFRIDQTEISESHKQLLQRVCNAIVGRKEFKCFLIAAKSEAGSDLEKYQKRLLSILNYLRSCGLEGSRVSLGVEASDGASQTESVFLRLMKTD
ncbi:MAG: PD40 domain-containing protein [Cyclobacteriaceae bacterium]|nr:PD40 domain-containing protein [Cyclobacteriaceae bacterium]